MSFAQWFGAVKEEKLSVAAPESNPSLPGGRRVRGYTISRLPFGAYLQALEKLQSLPGDLLKACFPGKAADEILTALKNLDEGALVQLIAGAAGAGAPYLLELISDFSGIPQDELRDDPAIGLDGLTEIVQAVWEINGLKNVLAAAKALKRPAPPTPTGFKA